MSRNPNPAIVGFIMGQEGEGRAKADIKEAKRLAERYGIDVDTVLLYGKTYGWSRLEEALAKKYGNAKTFKVEISFDLNEFDEEKLTPEYVRRILEQKVGGKGVKITVP